MSKRLSHYKVSTCHENHPDVALLHTSLNDINNQTNNKVNTKKLATDVISIGKYCINFGVDEVITSSILLERKLD